MAPTVLIVEDDAGISMPLERTLGREGYQVDLVSDGAAAVARALTGSVDLMILDLGLPDIDGLEVCRRVRSGGYQGGVLILTARDGELDRVVGLDVGADDYMAKPFGLAELLARTRALLRRSVVSGADEATSGSANGGLRVDTEARRVWVKEREIALTTKEFDVLALLNEHQGAVVTRERLMDEVWDSNWFGSTKTLDVTIGRLRQKLDQMSAPAKVVTVRGVGFRLEAGEPGA
ncbi:MAG: response regulator transcription factor [Nocardioidaceae bacterium]